MKYFALTYDVVENFAERRMVHREPHLKLAREAYERGEIIMAGAVGDPPEEALIIFRAEDAAVAEAFVKDDPYIKNGLVTSWKVRPWKVVIGGGA